MLPIPSSLQFCVFFGGTKKKTTREGGPVFGLGSSSSRWFLAPDSKIATGFWSKSLLGGHWTNPSEEYAEVKLDHLPK